MAAGAFVALTASGSSPSPERIQAWVDGLGAAGPLLFVPLSVTLSCLFVPAPALAGAAGLLFGIALGLPLAILAAVGAASAQYLITRHLARD